MDPPADPLTLLRARLATVHNEIEAACRRVGRSPDEVRLVVVTKAAPASIFPLLAQLGSSNVGENRVQSAAQRQQGWRQAFRWHLVGHLQANKVRRALACFDVFHGVDSIGLMRRLDRIAGELGQRPELMLQVNVSGEASKQGLEPEQLPEALRAAANLSHARLTGLMTMAPRVESPEQARPVFAELARLRDRLGAPRELSMGMSNDFATAVEEGASLVRVGRGIVAPEGLG